LRSWYSIAIGFDWVKLELRVNLDLMAVKRSRLLARLRRGKLIFAIIRRHSPPQPGKFDDPHPRVMFYKA
jgi:hypothetical protein